MRPASSWCPSLVLGLAALVTLACAAGAHPSIDARVAQLSIRIAAEPHDASLLLERASAHRDHADWRAARADIDAARALDSETPGLDLASAACAIGEGQLAAALTDTDRAIALDARDANAWVLRAAALERLGRPDDAAAALGEALAVLSPRERPQPDLYLDLARLLARGPRSRTQEALDTLDAGIARLGPLVSLTLPAIDLESKLGRFAAARRRLEALPLADSQKAQRRTAIVAAEAAAR